MSIVDLYLTREETFGLKVGGIKRITCWLTEPRREHRQERTIFAGELWVADTDPFPATAFKAAKADDVANAIWTTLEKSAFPGIPYEQWEGPSGHLLKDHPDSVPASSWIGQVKVRIETTAFEGATPFPITLTGPYGERARFRRPPKDSPNLAWLGPPRLERGRKTPACPFEGIAARDCWHQPKRAGVINAGDFRKAGVDDIASAIESAFAKAPERMRRSWSATVETWIGLP